MGFEVDFHIFIDPDYLLDDKRNNRFTTADIYVNSVRNVLININKTKVGNALLRSIKYHRKIVRIFPTDLFNANSCAGAAVLPTGQAKDLLYNRYLVPVFNLLPIRAAVEFIPNMYTPGGPCHKFHQDKSGGAPTPERVLLHELVHAFRKISNKETRQPEFYHGGLTPFDTREEFYAILIENIFQSEVGDNLRGQHLNFHNLEKQLEGSLEFFKVSRNAFKEIERFCKENPGFTRVLADAKVSFNPIRAYYKNPTRAKENSKSHFAATRDAGPLGALNKFLPSFSWEVWRQLVR